MNKKIAVSARGEIAKRVISTCHQMGLKTVLLYAAGDEKSEAFRFAGERVCIGPADPEKSYLNISANVEGALGAGAVALHPGYGFLSENPEFARHCEKRGLIFIGPPPEAIELFGNKMSARKACEKAGVAVLPGGRGAGGDLRACKERAEQIGWPVMIKAESGGGGRGLRKARNHKELESLIPRVMSEAEKNFQSRGIFIEKYLEGAKHIEVQVFVSADGEVYILGDRDCSLQRRHQKILEEAPASLPEKTRERLSEAARAILTGQNYRSAGTLEFLFKGGEFYFLEMNTRLQVEHTVTETLFGVDLVRAQILTAFGQPAFLSRQDLKPRGHSIQCRICAEDPFRRFLPSAGGELSCRWPGGAGVRLDKGFDSGDLISPHYDSLLAKLIVRDISRPRAVEKMKTALKETIIFGCAVNIPFLQTILLHPDFIENKIKTDFVEKNFPEGIKPEPFPFDRDFMARVAKALRPPGAFNPWKDFLKNGDGK